MRCSKCNAENLAGSSFCAECGAPIVSNSVIYETEYMRSVGTMVGGIVILVVCVLLCVALTLDQGRLFLPGGALGIGSIFMIVAGAKKSKFTVKRESVEILWQGNRTDLKYSFIEPEKLKLKGKTLVIGKKKYKFNDSQNVYEALSNAVQTYKSMPHTDN